MRTIKVYKKTPLNIHKSTFNKPLKVIQYGTPAPKGWWKRLGFVFRPYRVTGGIVINSCTFQGIKDIGVVIENKELLK